MCEVTESLGSHQTANKEEPSQRKGKNKILFQKKELSGSSEMEKSHDSGKHSPRIL